MFGYVRPFRDELKVRDLDRWQHDYCGLCRCLGKRYGFAARFLVRYDMTFLYSFLTLRQDSGSTKRCWCPASVCRRKTCTVTDDAMEYAADLTILLSCGKLRDEIADGRGLRRFGARLLLLLYRCADKKAAAARPRDAARIAEQLRQLSDLERARCDSIDRTADAFAEILRGCADWWRDPGERRAAGQTLYHVGRFVYLVDALDDLKKDCASDSYNPLRYRFRPADGALSEADLAYFHEILDASVDLAASAFELLDRGRHGAIPENILYYGLPSVLRAVEAGKFHPQRRKL